MSILERLGIKKKKKITYAPCMKCGREITGPQGRCPDCGFCWFCCACTLMEGP